MEPFSVPHYALPHTAKLFEDYVYHFERVAPFYDHDPHDPGAFRRAAAGVQFADGRRAALLDAMRQQNGPSSKLDLLAKPGTVAVLTGQQVGLFSGPCYTVYKALTAAHLARRLSESGTPAVPVFWLATEDHDFVEANHCWVFNAENQPVRLELPAAAADRRPVGGIPVDGAPIDALRAALGRLPFAEETVEMVTAAYASGETFGSAFQRLLARILPDAGLLFFDPMHPASRLLAAPLLSEAVARAPELTRLVLERNAALAAAGYHVQVHVEPETSFVFLLEGGLRIALHRDGDEFSGNGRRLSAAELAARAEELSPNALLRPVVQDSMFPTVAYVGGPAELAYLAQSQVLYRRLLGRAPVAVPRQSATLLDGRTAKIMSRFSLTLPDFFAGEAAVREKIAQRLIPEGMERTFSEIRAEAGTLTDRVSGTLAAFDPTLERAFAVSRRKILYQLEKTGRKAAREALRRDARASAGAAYATGLVFPNEHLQERLYSIVPFLARHGPDVIATISDGLRQDCPDHRVLVV